jgi:hypothetical protein
MAAGNFFETALQSDRGAECIRLWGAGMSAREAFDRAFGDGAVDHMAKQVWLTVRVRPLLEQVSA